jgi:uncharacterized protein (DUF2225 family)
MSNDYYKNKEIECPFCHNKIKPKVESNKFRLLKIPVPQFIHSSVKEKKYILVCPNCKAVIGSK